MKKLFVLVLSLSVIFVAGSAGYHGYHVWKQKHLMKQARAFISKSDGAKAILCLRQALASNPGNLEACKLMVQFAELAQSPEALYWSSRVVDLEPDSLTNRLVLARIAMGAGDAKVAERALGGVNADGKKTAIYHKVAGSLDLAERRFSAAEDHLSEAVRLEPANPRNQLAMATLRLQKTDLQAAGAARATLVALCTNSQVRGDAFRQLAQDSLRHTNLNGALAISKQLLSDTNAIFADRMLYLDLLRATTNAQEGSFLASLQSEAVSNVAKAYEVSKWMLGTGKPQATLAWLKTLPLVTRTNLPVPMIESDCYMAMKDWSGLLTNLATQTWNSLDCLRLLSRSRAFKEQGAVTSAKTEWIQAVKATRDNLQLLVQLLKTTGAWNWKAEQEEVLWTIFNRYPNEKWVIQPLGERLYAEGNTRGLQSLFSLAMQRDQTNAALMNNLASTALLTESWDKKPHELARELYSKAGTNASYIATYAYSLLVQRQAADALKVIERLTPQQLEDPSIALYYGLILKSSGNASRAARYFEIAAKATLLPEERKLLDRARHGA